MSKPPTNSNLRNTGNNVINIQAVSVVFILIYVGRYVEIMFQATYVGSFNALRGYIITLLPGHKSDSFIRTVSIFIIDR